MNKCVWKSVQFFVKNLVDTLKYCEVEKRNKKFVYTSETLCETISLFEISELKTKTRHLIKNSPIELDTNFNMKKFDWSHLLESLEDSIASAYKE